MGQKYEKKRERKNKKKQDEPGSIYSMMNYIIQQFKEKQNKKEK